MPFLSEALQFGICHADLTTGDFASAVVRPGLLNERNCPLTILRPSLTALDRALLFLLALPVLFPWEKAWGWSLELESPWNSEPWSFLASTPGHWFPLSRGPSPFPLSVSHADFPCSHLLHSGCPPRIKDLGGSWVPWKLQWTRAERERTEISTMPLYLELSTSKWARFCFLPKVKHGSEIRKSS